MIAEVPGLSKEDLDVKIQGNIWKSVVRERSKYRRVIGCIAVNAVPHSFTRSLTLPADVDSGKVSAALNGRIADLDPPKSEAAKPRRFQSTKRNRSSTILSVYKWRMLWLTKN